MLDIIHVDINFGYTMSKGEIAREAWEGIE
jgi:hypothetical protein